MKKNNLRVNDQLPIGKDFETHVAVLDCNHKLFICRYQV